MPLAPGTVLDDNHRRDAAEHAGLTDVPVLVYSDLSEADEQLVFAAAQLAGRTHCELPAETVYRIGSTYEREYRDQHGVARGRGGPTSIHVNGSSKQGRETDTVVARYLGVSPSFYRACKVVFGDAGTEYENLRAQARADRKLVRKGADIIRKALSAHRKKSPKRAQRAVQPEPGWICDAYDAWVDGLMSATNALEEPHRSFAVALADDVGVAIQRFWRRNASRSGGRHAGESEAAT